jgi:hypothetical protein
MSQTNLLILDLDVSGNDQADGIVQLTYSITSGVMASGATLTYQVNKHSNASTIATTASSVTGVANGTSTVYTVASFTVPQFSLPANGTFNGGKFEGVGFVLTVDASGVGTLTGVFVPEDETAGDPDLSWSASTDAPFPIGEKYESASGKS